MQADHLINSLRDFFEERVKELELCITVDDDPITPFKRFFLVWDKLKLFLSIAQRPEAQSLEGLNAELTANLYNVDKLTAMYRCASKACTRGMRDMRHPPQEDPEEPWIFQGNMPNTREWVDYRSLEAGGSSLIASILMIGYLQHEA